MRMNRKLMKQRLLLVVTLWLLCTQPRAIAEVVFSSFGAGDVYDTLNGNPIDGLSAPEPSALAEQFVPAGSFYLDSVDLGLSWNAGGPDVRVEVYSESAGAPGNLLESSQVNSFSSGVVSAAPGGDCVVGEYGDTSYQAMAQIAQTSHDLSQLAGQQGELVHRFKL